MISVHASVQPILSRAQTRDIERSALARGERLMQRAGRSAAALAMRMLGHRRRVLALVGPGNNGGDAIESACLLADRGVEVVCVSLGDPAALPPDAAFAYARWSGSGRGVLGELPALDDYDLIIDGLFGIGLTREPRGDAGLWIERVNASGVPVLALDVPSGIDADSGSALGRAIRASQTLTFIGLKAGLFTGSGPD